MKIIYQYIVLACVLLLSFSGCIKDEDPIYAELGGPLRNYDVNSSDPIFKYVSQYYSKYGKEFIVDVDSSDYLYNFISKNRVKMSALEGSTAEIQAYIDFVNDIFLSRYSDVAIKKAFPNSILIANTINDLGRIGDPLVDYFTTNSYFSIALSNRTISSTTPEARAKFAFDINSKFIEQFLYGYNKIDLSHFFAFCDKIYATKEYNVERTLEEAYEMGILEKPYYNKYMNPPYTEWTSKTKDLQLWITFMINPPSNAQTLKDTYPVLKAKFDAFAKALSDVGIDHTKLQYKIN